MTLQAVINKVKPKYLPELRWYLIFGRYANLQRRGNSITNVEGTVIQISRDNFSTGILYLRADKVFKDIALDALIGAVAHEFSHIIIMLEDYQRDRKNYLQGNSPKRAPDYRFAQILRKWNSEWHADLDVVRRGFGENLLKFVKILENLNGRQRGHGYNAQQLEKLVRIY